MIIFLFVLVLKSTCFVLVFIKLLCCSKALKLSKFLELFCIVLSQIQQQLVSTCNTIGFHFHQVWVTAISFAGFVVFVQR